MKASTILFAFLSMTITLGIVSPAPLYADAPVKGHKAGTSTEGFTLHAEGLYRVVVLDKNTGEVVDERVQYCPQGTPIHVPEVAPDEIIVFKKVSVADNPFTETIDSIDDINNIYKNMMR